MFCCCADSSRSQMISPSTLVLIVLLYTFIMASGSAQMPSPIFTSTNTIQVGAIYSGATVTDLNADGKPDLVYFDSPTGLTVVLDLLGTAVTEPSVSFTCSTSFAQPTVGDVNDDGKPDVVFSCTTFLVVLLGNGDGTFANPAYYAANKPSDPVLVDLNGDKYPDVAALTTGTSGSQVSVFLNKGAAGPGTLAAAVNYSPGNAAPSLNAPLGSGDFNGDGRADLVAFSGAGYVLFVGNGDGTLQTPIISSSQGATTFVTGDFNGDGITDIAYAHSATTSTSFSYPQILLGAVSGIFSQGPALATAGGQNSAVYLATSPLPSTGPLGLVVSGAATTVYKNDGKGNFTQTGNYAPSGIDRKSVV